MGAPEAAIRVLSMWLIQKTRKVTFVSTNAENEHTLQPKQYEQLLRMEDDDENPFATSIHDRYAARPNKLEEMCLGKFAVSYDLLYKKGREEVESPHIVPTVEEDAIDVHIGSSHRNEIIELRGGLDFMRKRSREAVLQFKSFSLAQDPERYYFARLLLFQPCRSESDLLDGFSSCKEKYLSVKEVVQMQTISMIMLFLMQQCQKLLKMGPLRLFGMPYFQCLRKITFKKLQQKCLP